MRARRLNRVRREARRCVVATCTSLLACSGQTSEPPVRSLDDLFDAASYVRVDDGLLRTLTNRVSEQEAEKLGRTPGLIPISKLRSDAASRPTGTGQGFAHTVVAGEHLAASVAPIPREVLETPYWPSIFRRVGAVADERTYVATNLFYRVYTFIGGAGPVDSIVASPPSWHAPRSPREGEFPPERKAEWFSYLDSLMVVDGLAAICDSVLVVSTGRFREAAASAPSKAPHLLHVYMNGQPRGLDLPSPGDLVAYSNSSLFLLVTDGRPGSRLVEYVWRGTVDDGRDPSDRGCPS